MCIVLIWFVWNFLLVLFCGSRGKKAGTANNCCMTSVYILYTGWHKQPPKMRVSRSRMQKKKSDEILKWVSLLLHESVCTHSVCCSAGEWKQQHSYRSIMLFIGCLKKDSGEWLFWVVNKAQWPFSFHWWNPSAHICCLIPWEHKISNQTGSFGPEVLILFFSNFFVKWPYPQFT